MKHDDWQYANPVMLGAYIRHLWELRLDEEFEVDYAGEPLPAFRAGFCFGAGAVIELLDDDAKAELVDALRHVYIDEIALHEEGYKGTSLIASHEQAVENEEP